MTDLLKPGQKFPTPTRGHGDRVFYETLLRQNPSSAMAQDWCIAYGVLPTKEAEKIFKLVVKRKGGGGGGGGAVAAASSSSSGTPKKRKKEEGSATKKKKVKKES